MLVLGFCECWIWASRSLRPSVSFTRIRYWWFVGQAVPDSFWIFAVDDRQDAQDAYPAYILRAALARVVGVVGLAGYLIQESAGDRVSWFAPFHSR